MPVFPRRPQGDRRSIFSEKYPHVVLQWYHAIDPILTILGGCNHGRNRHWMLPAPNTHFDGRICYVPFGGTGGGDLLTPDFFSAGPREPVFGRGGTGGLAGCSCLGDSGGEFKGDVGADFNALAPPAKVGAETFSRSMVTSAGFEFDSLELKEKQQGALD